MSNMVHVYAVVSYLGILAFPFLILMGWLWWRNKWRFLAAVGIVLSVLFIYSRFIEPYWLVVYHEKPDAEIVNIPKPLGIKVAVVSDIHLSLHKREDFLERIVKAINTEQPDFVLIPGDFTYAISKQELAVMFAGLEDIEAPVYAVTGNHDGRHPGEFTSEEVRKTLQPFDVHTIDNKVEHINVRDKDITIVGLSDLWEGESDYTLVNRIQEEDFTIILTHNPDSAYELPSHKADLLVAGHTHGGQIRIPFVYPKVIPTDHPFDRGWYKVKGMPVFVTSGAGEVGLPMRLGVPPEVVIVEL